MKKICALILLCLCMQAYAQQPALQKTDISVGASFRGLSVVDDHVAWLSGTEGAVGRSTDGGKTWSFKQVKGFEKSDFRTVYAFDSTKAIIANAGTPACILYTADAGGHWEEVYRNESQEAFIDGTDFWNDKNGYVYGDPIQGKLLFLRTTDGGRVWEDLSDGGPDLYEGEAAFAASGTAIRCLEKKKLVLATGGIASRLMVSKDMGWTWKTHKTPILQGVKSTGIFSMAFKDDHVVIVGGDYLRDTLAYQHNFYSDNGGKSWSVPVTPTRGYRECVEYVGTDRLIAVGPSGVDVSNDNGLHWAALSDIKQLHTGRKARNGSLVILAGAKGQVYLLK